MTEKSKIFHKFILNLLTSITRCKTAFFLKMKNFLIAFVVFLVWSFFGLCLYSWLKTENTQTASGLSAEDSLRSEESYLEINEPKVTGLKGENEDGDIIFMFREGVSILENSSEVFVPEAITDFKYKINSYLLEHPNKVVHINSLYSANENFESPNLGVQRGEKIKKILLRAGISKEKIVIKSVIKGINFNKDGYYDNSISIFFRAVDISRVENLKFKMPNTKIIYPSFSNSVILIDNNLKILLEEIKEAVKNNPEIKIEVIGHTDNIGNDIDNYRMGLTYSKQIEFYLVAKGGIEKSKIKSSSKGEAEPIDTNNSERGRIENRRIEIVFY